MYKRDGGWGSYLISVMFKVMLHTKEIFTILPVPHEHRDISPYVFGHKSLRCIVLARVSNQIVSYYLLTILVYMVYL